MKLHLNLALRRALMAAMAVVALHAAQATVTHDKGNLYVTNSETPDTTQWAQYWENVTGALSVGTSAAEGKVIFEEGEFATPGAVYVGGKGLDTDGAVANNGEIVVKSPAKFHVATELNLGNSHIGGTGTLTLTGGAVTVGESVYVGVNLGQGAIKATDGASLEVLSGAKGAVFAMSYRNMPGKLDDAYFEESSITVGTKSGVKDYTSIGHSQGTANLVLVKSTGTFADQILVGEKSGSDGTIYVRSKSTLNLQGNTVLGAEAGANGRIIVEASNVFAEDVTVGNAGQGEISLFGTNAEPASLEADNITLGNAAGAEGGIVLDGGSGTVDADLLTIGNAGSGSVKGSGAVKAKNVILGNAATADGSLEITEGSVQVDESLYVGYRGTGTASIADGTLTAENAYVVGNNSTLTTEEDGTTTLGNAIVLGGALETDQGGTTKVSKELILDANGKAQTAGDMEVASATIHDSSRIDVDSTGELTTTGSVVNEGTIAVAGGGAWNADGGTLSTAGSIENDGTLHVGGSLSTSDVSGTGTTLVEKDGEWDITGDAAQGTITNEGAITVHGDGRVVADTLSGTGGTTTIVVNGSLVSTTPGEAVITLTNTPASDVKVDIDTDNGTSLIGKNVDFVSVNGSLITLTDDSFIVDDGWTINWADMTITSATTNRYTQIDFTGNQAGMHFTKQRVIEITDVEDESNTVDSVLEVVTETSKAENDSLTNRGETIVPDASECVIDPDTKLHFADLGLGLNDQGDDIRTNVIIGENVTSTGDVGSTKVQSVVINQKTTINGQVNRETLGTTCIILLFDGTSEHFGQGKTVSELGFAEGTETGTVITQDAQGVEIRNDIKKVDLVQVDEGADVTLSELSMHATHAMTMDKGSKLTLDAADLHVGGAVDIHLTKVVNVIIDDENGKAVGTRKETVETDNHLSVDSIISGAELAITNGSNVVFEKVDNDDKTTPFGSTTFDNSVVELSGNSSLGNSADHMQTIVFVNGSVLKGSGTVSNIHMKEGTTLQLGNSPGVLKVSDSKFDATNVKFCWVTNSGSWSASGNTANADPETGAVSQLDIDKAVTLNNASVSVYYEKKDAQGYVASTRDEMTVDFQEGASITLITGNLDELSGTYTFDESALPELEAGLFWDTEQLFSTGKIFVVGEILEEPTRIANTMVSAGETVLNFGRLTEVQARLRAAGTTRTWASAIANFDGVDTGHATNGYDYSNWGAAVGVDHAFAKNTVMGVAFGCTWGENEPEHGNEYYDAGSIDQDSKMIGLYGVHKFRTKGLMNDVKLNAFAAYGWFEHDSTRTALRSGNKATAEWDSEAWVLSASLSRDITTDEGTVFTPYVGVEYTKAGLDSFTEKGHLYDARYTADADYSNLAVKVGVNVSKAFGSFTPYAGIAFVGDVARDASEVTARGRRVIKGESALPGREALQLRVGANWKLTETLDVNAGYSAEIRSKATEHNANVGIGLTF